MFDILMLTEGLSENTTLTKEEKIELFAGFFEPFFNEHWKKLSKRHHYMFKLFCHLEKIGYHKFELIAKAFNSFAKSTALSNIYLIVKMRRHGKELLGFFISERDFCFFDKRRS